MRKRELFNGNDVNPNKNIFSRLSGKSLDDIEYLGRETIRRMIQEWRWYARELVNRTKELNEAQGMSEGRRAEKQDDLIRQKRRIDTRIKLLLALEKRAEQKPIVAPARPCNWVKIGYPVICYVVPGQGFAPLRQGFMGGTVAEDAGELIVVSFVERLHDGSCLEGHGINVGRSDPRVMRVGEYKYLLTHPDFARAWIDQTYPRAPKDRNFFNHDEFLHDLRRGTTGL